MEHETLNIANMFMLGMLGLYLMLMAVNIAKTSEMKLSESLLETIFGFLGHALSKILNDLRIAVLAVVVSLFVYQYLFKLDTAIKNSEHNTSKTEIHISK